MTTATINKKAPRSGANRVIPGYGLSLGYTLFYLSFIVLIPLSMVFYKSAALGWHGFWETISTDRVRAAFKLSFGASFLAAVCNVFAGTLVAWVLVRYRFFGKRIVDAMIDLPFALPTSVAGISLAAVYANTGLIGHFLAKFGIKVAYTPLGVFVALLFIGLPFVVRTVQPVLEEIDTGIEEAAASLGASRWQTIRRVIFPTILPAVLTGFSLAFARAVGEYGSVIFISNNKPFEGEILPKLIIEKLEQYNYAGATSIGAAMLIVSFALLLVINMLQRWAGKWQ